MNELEHFDRRLEGLIAALSPKARKALAVTIAKKLRASQQQRIKRQQAPDGTPYVPRKPQPLRKKKGRVKREMFSKLPINRYLKARARSDSAVVKFTDRVQRIARVHHYGLDEKNALSTKKISYPPRLLFGFDKHIFLEVEKTIERNFCK